MRIRHTTTRGQDRIELQMTPMIDIVFQLLVFFIFTFKIVPQEGDFYIRMPLAAPQAGVPDPQQIPPMTLRLSADDQGQLTSIQLNEQSFPDFDALHRHILQLFGGDAGPSLRAAAEVELDVDYQLRYEYVIQAFTAVSGYVSETGEIVTLVDKIKFAPPKTPASSP